MEFEISKTMKIMLMSLVLLTVLIFASFNIWEYLFGTNPNKELLTEACNEHFYGRVDSTYYDKKNHNTKIALIHGGYLYQIYNVWEAKIETQDSLYKEKGSPQVIVFKKNGHRIVLDYREIIKTR
ncbi:MAG: hypothetical protein M3O71_23845 [Bacteroidota bacterium]|nr:hypothetical protein [Bacteroidota bacterium]